MNKASHLLKIIIITLTLSTFFLVSGNVHGLSNKLSLNARYSESDVPPHLKERFNKCVDEFGEANIFAVIFICPLVVSVGDVIKCVEFYDLEIADYANNLDELKNICSQDDDNDGIKNYADNCVDISNPDQIDLDKDEIGDLCDNDIDPSFLDRDEDGIIDDDDNCPDISNSDQSDIDGDDIGDKCDDDVDGDGVLNDEDNCPDIENSSQNDMDDDGIGDVCDDDMDGDGILNDLDNCEQIHDRTNKSVECLRTSGIPTEGIRGARGGGSCALSGTETSFGFFDLMPLFFGILLTLIRSDKKNRDKK